MADVRVPLFGSVRKGSKSYGDPYNINVTWTYVCISENLTLVETIHHGPCTDVPSVLDDARLQFGYPLECIVGTRTYVPVVMGAMELPLSRLLVLIDRVCMNPSSHLYGCLPDCMIYPGLWSLRRFRMDAIERAVRVKAAARTIWRQFKESRDNPNFRLCQKRLLGEFEDLQEEVAAHPGACPLRHIRSGFYP